ncbi:MAG: hypothetical protein AAF799_47160 [Myxococcota bacterium]
MRRLVLTITLAAMGCTEADGGSGDSDAATGGNDSAVATTNSADDATGADDDSPATGADDDSGDGADPTGGDTQGEVEFDAPAEEEALVAFLDAMGYAGWAAEPDYHESTGPHGPGVRTFYSPKAVQALESGAEQFPAGAATVKELTSEGFLYGWGVWVKAQDDSDGGNGIYWYELIRGEDGDQVYGNAFGSNECIGCHSGGFDFLLSDGTFE